MCAVCKKTKVKLLQVIDSTAGYVMDLCNIYQCRYGDVTESWFAASLVSHMCSKTRDIRVYHRGVSKPPIAL